MSAELTLLDPVEFLQPNRRLFIDTNMFMDTDPRRAGGLKRLFERGQGAILKNDNPIVVPTKVVGELIKQSCIDTSTESAERAEAVRKAGAALTFLESASRVRLIRTDLGDDTNPYADDLFLRLFEQFAGRYEMCLLTHDITIKLRIRLLAHRLGGRLIVGVLTKDGDLEVEHDQALFERGNRKRDRHAERIASNTGNFKDESEVATLGPLLDEFRKAVRLIEPDPRVRFRRGETPVPTPVATGSALVKPFAATRKIKPRDTALPFASLPTQGEKVTWESASESGTFVLGPLVGEGGEGSVYEGADKKTVVKIFDKDHVTRHRQEKIHLLVSHGLQLQGVCVPSALVRNSDGEFVGYVMPRASGREFQRTIFNKRKFAKEFPTWTKADLVDVCISFLEKVQYLHSLNIVVGDINPKNLMVDDRKNVFIIDVDSWQAEGYPCPVGTPMFTSPAMLGKAYAEDLRTMEDEFFAVATMLFMVVMTGQFPYIRTGTDGDVVQLIKEGNFAFQYENRNNKDQPNGDWKYMWSHIHKPVKDLFWHTFHKEGKRYKKRPTATEWLDAFRAYKAYLANKRLNFDPMSNDVYPIRNKAFRPDTPIQDCPGCGRQNAIAGIWSDDNQEYFVPRQCNKCKDSQPTRTAAVRGAAPRAVPPRVATPATFACKDCGKNYSKAQLTYGRCPTCTTKANSLDPARLCVDCRQPFITYDHIGWFTSRFLDVPKSHAAIKQSCPPVTAAKQRMAPKSGAQPLGGFWARLKQWFQDN
ncbi:hypothetical protein ACFWGN_11100 [Oerskovia sp. NPDC060338]|uniref:protein kinase domain-containing protein n=1 Tax=Oerskovia sp. NPDC060338 TaxID=3347100 RepID=UPI003664797C